MVEFMGTISESNIHAAAAERDSSHKLIENTHSFLEDLYMLLDCGLLGRNALCTAHRQLHQNPPHAMRFSLGCVRAKVKMQVPAKTEGPEKWSRRGEAIS